jgi:phospho-N-acetylmuramoyl-pentapeptide-transferase
MVRLGIGHARTAIAWYVLMLLGALLALWALSRPVGQQWAVLFAWYGVLACCGAVIDQRWRRFQRCNDV